MSELFRRMTVTGLVPLLLLAGSQGFAGNDSGGDWYDGRDVWKSLEDFKNETVEVLEVGGRLVSGQLADVTETFVLVERKETQNRVDRDKVHRITFVRASTRKRNTLRGLAIGVGTFGLFSYGLTHGTEDDFAKWTFLGVVAVGTVGAVGGSIIGYMTSSPESRVIIYESPPIPAADISRLPQ